MNTDHIRIKSFANALLIPDMGLIDEEYEKISLSKGACVELKLIMGNWYILSSDGLKLNLN